MILRKSKFFSVHTRKQSHRGASLSSSRSSLKVCAAAAVTMKKQANKNRKSLLTLVSRDYEYVGKDELQEKENLSVRRRWGKARESRGFQRIFNVFPGPFDCVDYRGRSDLNAVLVAKSKNVLRILRVLKEKKILFQAALYRKVDIIIKTSSFIGCAVQAWSVLLSIHVAPLALSLTHPQSHYRSKLITYVYDDADKISKLTKKYCLFSLPEGRGNFRISTSNKIFSLEIFIIFFFLIIIIIIIIWAAMAKWVWVFPPQSNANNYSAVSSSPSKRDSRSVCPMFPLQMACQVSTSSPSSSTSFSSANNRLRWLNAYCCQLEYQFVQVSARCMKMSVNSRDLLIINSKMSVCVSTCEHLCHVLREERERMRNSLFGKADLHNRVISSANDTGGIFMT